MNRQVLILIAIFGLSFNSVFGGDDALFSIDGEPVGVSEFEYIYNKNNFNNKADYSEASLREYLELYINFRLKVKEAEAMGLDKDPKLHSELKVYQEQLYNSFYDREKLGALLDEAIERMDFDISISHIYVNAPKGYGAAKIEAGRAKIQEAYDALKSGKSWEVVAKSYSEDKYSKDNGGYLGYYTSLQIAHYPLENAAYNTTPGEYSEPIQTDLGFHIVKVNDKRPARGMVSVAVIKLNKKESDDAFNKGVANQITAIHAQAVSGKDFAELAGLHSQDPTTSKKGGEMDWFGISKYDPVFENAAFGLKDPGDISKPFETKSAWYILKLLDKKNGGAADADRELISKKVKQSDRYTLQRKEHIANILDQHGFELIQPAFDNYRKFAIERFATNIFKFEEVETESPIVNITGVNYSNKLLGEYLTRNTFKYRRLAADVRFDQLFEDFKEEKAIEFHIHEYAKENAEYGALMKEYRDGILLFDLMEQMVWSKAVKDTSGLREYFNSHQENFKNPERAEIRTYEVANDKQAAFLIKALKSDPELTNLDWLNKLSKKDINTSHGNMVVKKDDAIADQIDWAEGIYSVNNNGQSEIWQVTGFLPEDYKSFNDSRGFAIAEYQEYLEHQWIEELRQKYEVVIDEEVLMGLVK